MAITPGRTLILLAAVAVMAACTPEPAPAPTTIATTTPPTTIGVIITSSGPAAVTVSEGVDPEVAEALQVQLEDLRGVTETTRGLRFLDPPRIALVTDSEFPVRRRAAASAGLQPEALAVETQLLQTLGLMGSGQGLQGMLEQVASEDVPAFYDVESGELVVAASTPMDPHDRSVIVREMVRALVDVYHRYGERVPELRAAGLHDEADALQALVDADATYFQLVYIQELPPPERTEAVAARPVTTAHLPDAVNTKLSFPFEFGIPFIEALLQDGDLAALDGAYGSESLTTEHIRHPVRFLAAEGVRPVPAIDVALPGYTLETSGTWGSASLESILVGSLPPGLLTQTIDGWGGDQHALHRSGSDLAFVYSFRADTVDDAIEVAQAFLNQAAGAMRMRDPVVAGGGVEFMGTVDSEDPESGPYVFVDRESEGLVVVVADEPATGRLLRDSVPVP